ncbi:hypothetical protein POM88_001025 [Heracleum sosnowskyi]|uniref:P-type ATPase A domain-containing protein n=1 Tax=Heracleum sosnowskyi TaxID=360622 RepID=A0AAD8JBC9_9APIA|nr:hypothetical protein POM88_001025 [Heracleum sosnowskyi]
MENEKKEVPSPSKGLLQSPELYQYILESSVYPNELEPLKELRAVTAKHPSLKLQIQMEAATEIDILDHDMQPEVEEHMLAAGLRADAMPKHVAIISDSKKILCDGKWSEQDASVLVPGDIISIKLGDIIPTDARLLQGDPLKIDQIKKVVAGEDASELIANGKSHGREWLKGGHGKTASLASTLAPVVAWTGVV